MNFNKPLSLSLFFVFFYCSQILATHIVGGELSYKCLGNDRYEVSLTVFRDCDTGIPAFDNPASIGIFDGLTNSLLGDIRLTVMNDDTLSESLLDPCFVIPPNVCIHGTVYRDTITLPYRANGYILSYQRCCRNQDIMNIVSPLATGATYMIHISPEALLVCNNSPSFNAWPPLYLCRNQPFEFDHSAIDIDGDSLVYELCSPFDGATELNPMPQPPFAPPYDSIRWLSNAGYSTQNMMGGNSPLFINNQNGLLTVTPPNLGVFVVGVRVKEYRNGVLISTVQRDFQYIVGECGRRNNAAFFLPSIICSNDLAVEFNNQSNSDINLYQWDFGVVNSNTDTSTQTSPIFVYPAPGRYTVKLIAAPNTICTDSFSQTIDVRYNNIIPSFSYRLSDTCSTNIDVYFRDSSIAYLDEIIAWSWDFGDGNISNTQHPIHNYTHSGDYSVRLIVTAANGCQDTIVENISISLPNIHDFDDLYFCGLNNSIALNPNADPNISYTWSPAQYLSNVNTSNPIMTIDAQFQGISYTVEMIALNSNGATCSASAQLNVNRAPSINMNLVANPQICNTSGNVSISEGNFSNISWSFNPNMSPIIDTGAIINYNIPRDSALLYVYALDEYNCVHIDSILIRRNIEPVIPIIQIIEENCGARLILQDNTNDNIISRYWKVSNTSGIVRFTSNDAIAIFNPINHREELTITLEVINANGCVGMQQESIITNVTKPLSADTLYKCVTNNININPNNTNTTGQSYIWSPATHLNNIYSNNPITSTVEDITYYVTITSNNGSSSCSFVDSVHIIAKPPITINAANYTYTCSNTARLEAIVSGESEHYNYNWYIESTPRQFVGSGNPIILPNIPEGTVFYVIVSDPLSGCSANTTITSASAPMPEIIPDFDFSILSCNGNVELQITDLSPYNDIINWQWISSLEPLRVEQHPLYSIPSSGTYNFTVSITLANGCGGVLNKPITVTTPRIPSNASQRIICPSQINTPIALNIPQQANMTYQWQAHPDLSATNIPSPIANVSQLPITYYVTITTQNNGIPCENIDSIVIDKPLPIAVDLGNDIVACNTNIVELLARSQNATFFEWATNSSFINSSIFSRASGSTYYLNNSNNTLTQQTIYLRVTDRYNCTAIDSVQITLHRYNISTTIAYTVENCENPITINFTPNTSSNSNTPIVNYQWTFGNNETGHLANPTVIYTPNINEYTGRYTVNLLVTDANNCRGIANTIINFSVADLTIADTSCSISNNIVLNANNPNPNLSYQWEAHPTFINNNLQDASQNVILTDTAHYRVTITSNIAGSTCSIIKNLLVGYNDFDYQIIRDTTVCSNVISLEVGGNNAWNYTWSLDSNFTRIIGYTNPLNANIHRNTTYYVRIENEAGCSKIDSIKVNKDIEGVLPNFNFEVMNCASNLGIQFNDLSISRDAPIVEWTWNFGDGNITNAISPFHNYITNGTYPVSLQITNALGCIQTISKVLNIEILDTLNTNYHSTICVGDSIILNPNAESNTQYIWDNTLLGLSDYNIAMPIARPMQNTTYTAQAIRVLNISSNQFDTCAINITHSVYIDSIDLVLPNINLACLKENTYINIEAIGSNNILTYTWSPTALIVSGQGSNTIRVNNLIGGENISVLATSFAGCTQRANTIIQVSNNGLNINLLSNRDTVRQGDSIQLIVNINNAENLNYTWSDNVLSNHNNQGFAIADFNGENHILYTITVSDNNQCTSIDSVYIFAAQSLCQEPYIFIPNTFTPNGDGLNDVLFVRGYNLTEFHFMIYNRWGELIFKSHDQNTPWDGTFKGKTLAPDVYGYYVQCRCEDGQYFEKKGNVTILK